MFKFKTSYYNQSSVFALELFDSISLVKWSELNYHTESIRYIDKIMGLLVLIYSEFSEY